LQVCDLWKRFRVDELCPLCPPMFPRTSCDGRELLTDSATSSGDLPNIMMTVDGLL
jgi:hypothetical protein